MEDQVSKSRWFTGTALLTGALVFGFYGIAISAKEAQREASDSQASAAQDALYIEECAACHMAYPAGLLPASSWRKMMRGLEDHFGDNAEMDSETAQQLNHYLLQRALQKGKPSRYSAMLRNMPRTPPLRITEFPYFINAHASVAKQLGIEPAEVGFFSPCKDCHKEAEQGIFDKDRLPMGYGPSFDSSDKQ